MQKILQLVNEAIEEIEKYTSCESAYFLLKYIASNGEILVSENADIYDITLDNLVLLAIDHETQKYKFFAISFYIYDYLSKKYRVQEPLFIFRWGKTNFIYSYRLEARLNYLAKNGFMKSKKGKIHLTPKGKEERLNLLSTLSKNDRDKVEELIKTLKPMKLKELKNYTKKFLFLTQ